LEKSEEVLNEIIQDLTDIIVQFRKSKSIEYLEIKAPLASFINRWWDEILDRQESKEYKRIMKEILDLIVLNRSVLKT
jgi:hypothetical protein